MSTVLVTGGSGFLASHIILQLLKDGHRVRTTVRNLKRESEVRAMLKEGGVDAKDDLSFFEADLEKDAGWQEAVQGCEFVLHVASPFPAGVPKHEDDLIVPAREGTIRVLRASKEARVKRVVLTSSFAAIGYGHKPQSIPFNETNWTNLNAKVPAYNKSKTIAEKAAWDFMDREGNGMELSVINPVGIFGPVLGSDFASSIVLLQRLLSGAMPGCPEIYFGVVDVRDVADLHLKAMTHPNAKGERFIAVSDDFIPMIEIANILRENLGKYADKVPKKQLPNLLVRLAGLFNPLARQILPELGKRKNATNEKAKRVLGWKPRSVEEAILSAAKSLERYTQK
ncbi:aldehyde reductase [Leptospira langatensis]|uniref:Aldehyde reductase n=1 Tax=Leptospira langatensis TaxID=2484983 RepID=A0A5F1ZSZ3_9LEPT|nr:aldehyde reductase [Leptospira langatensis]TGK00205.1 aldehyde reductase [Leptospira langatensis]TGL41165.1 aldehyde reductase [Leptospira langatensis]